jgi:uncharacterized membrane protein
MAAGWAAGFSYLAVARHLAGGSHAEDLGFTDQVLWNFLRGQWFRMSIYAGGAGGATWNTELDLSRVARPDSLLAFHVEPMLLAFVPLYALGAGAVTLLILQSVAVAAGAVPAYRLGRHLSRSELCGVAVAASYLLSPLGQWAVLADFHTSTLAGPLLLVSLERLLVGRHPVQALVAAALAATAREDVAAVLVGVGIALLLLRNKHSGAIPVWVGASYVLIGAACAVGDLLVIRHYSGGLSPFESRYDSASLVQMFSRPSVSRYATTLLLSGGWLGVLAPLALLPAVPILALNVLSSSPWMASGQAHYSALVLPFITLGAAAGLARLRTSKLLLHGAALTLTATSLVGYLSTGAGPLAANYAPAVVTDHALHASAIAAALPTEDAVSATSSLVPHLSHRARLYVFPAVLDADYVFLDLQASPGPTSAGDVYLRVQSLLATGDWQVVISDDGLMLLASGRGAVAQPARAPTYVAAAATTPEPQLLAAELVPNPDGDVGVDSPLWILRTTWQASAALPAGTQLDFFVNLRDGERVHLGDIAPLWWNPPEQWPIDQPITVDVPGIPVREFVSWSATWSTP